MTITQLLSQLTAASHDPMQPVWEYLATLCQSDNPERCLRLFLVCMHEVGRGRHARETNAYKEACPYREFDGLPLNAENCLRISWMVGFQQVDDSSNRQLCEKKLKEAYQTLDEAREVGEEGLGYFQPLSQQTFTPVEFRARIGDSEVRIRRCLDLVRDAWANMLTSPVKHQRRLEREAHDALLLDPDKDENPSRSV